MSSVARIEALPSSTKEQLFIIHYPLSIIHYPLSIIHYPLSIIHYPLSIIHYPLFIIHYKSPATMPTLRLLLGDQLSETTSNLRVRCRQLGALGARGVSPAA